MRLPRPRDVRQWMHQWRQPFTPGVMILLYHRVTRLEFDPQWLAVTPENFEAQMWILRRDFHPLSLTDAAQHIARGTIPRRSVVVTFDDGYADNLHEAEPILVRTGVPATVFIASGHIDGGEFWWDELEHILFGPENLPPRLALTIAGHEHGWTIGDAGRAQQTGAHKTWNVLSETTPTIRHRLYCELAPLIKPLSPEERTAVLAALTGWSGVARQTRMTHRPLTSAELATLGRSSAIAIGAHTVTHPMLARQPAAAQQQEIAASKGTLERILQRPVATFSYPFGGHGDYDEPSVQAVRTAGFACACANFPDRARRGCDVFQLPRFLVRDWPADEFRRQLREFRRA